MMYGDAPDGVSPFFYARYVRDLENLKGLSKQINYLTHFNKPFKLLDIDAPLLCKSIIQIM